MMYRHTTSYPYPAPIRPRSPTTQHRHPAIRRAELALKESERARQEQDRKARRRSSLYLITETNHKGDVASPRLVKARSNPLLSQSHPSSRLASTRARSRSQATLSSQLTFLPVPPVEPASKFSASTGKTSVVSNTEAPRDKRPATLSIGKLLKTPSRYNLRKKASRAEALRDEHAHETSSNASSSFFRRSPSRASSGQRRDTSLSGSQITLSSAATSRKSKKWTDRIKAVFTGSNKSSQSLAPSCTPSDSPGVVQMAERVSFSFQTRTIDITTGTVAYQTRHAEGERQSNESGRFSDAPSDKPVTPDVRPLSLDSGQSIARSCFRELLPSPTTESPKRDYRGLPVRSSSLLRKEGDHSSPKKAAMGAEQLISIIALDDDAPTAVQQVCGATTDLADLLVGFEDTMNVTVTNVIGSDGSEAGPKPQLSIDSLRSTVSDVPEDLKMLLASQQQTLTALSPVDASFVSELTSMTADASCTSFEGKATTAASALRHLLIEQHFPSANKDDDATKHSVATLSDSVRDYIQMERPSMGEKMFERSECEEGMLPSIVSPSTISSPAVIAHKRNVDSIPTIESPCPSHGPKVALRRYSQIPVKQSWTLSHSALPSNASSLASDVDAIPQSDLTQLSLTSLMSSPCPKPTSSIPMLTMRSQSRKDGPPVAPNFQFPGPRKQKSMSRLTSRKALKIRHQASLDSLFGPSPSVVQYSALTRGKADSKASPRFVRPLKPIAGLVQRPRRVSSSEDFIIGPDTPPASSSSDAASLSSVSVSAHSRQSSLASVLSADASFTIEQGQLVNLVGGGSSYTRQSFGHSRHVSAVSACDVPATIVEEADSPPRLTMKLSSSPPLLGDYSSGVDEAHSILFTVGHSPLKVTDDVVPLDISPMKPSPPRAAVEPIVLVRPHMRIEPYVFANAADLVQTMYIDSAAPMKTDAQEWCRFRFAADIELARSQELYPDTAFSHEEKERFDSPVTVEEIDDFLRDSQERFRSSFDSGCCLLPDDGIAILDDGQVIELDEDADRLSDMPAHDRRSNVLYESILKRSLNKSTKSEPSPFTALPPRLNIRSRVLAPKALNSTARKGNDQTQKRTSKQVDLGFLDGKRVTSRRIEQFDAARRKLEGTGRPDEQRSDEDEDDTTRSFGAGFSGRKVRQHQYEGEAAGDSAASFTRSRPASARKGHDRRRFAVSQMQMTSGGIRV